jgi:hypothetical protein
MSSSTTPTIPYQTQTHPHQLTQNELLTARLLSFFKKNDFEPLKKMLSVINGESQISLRIIDWFATNYAKKYYTVYTIPNDDPSYGRSGKRFKVYNDYKLMLKAYSKKRFDPFCRWDRIAFPYSNSNNMFIQTTVGQLNFFKWAIENYVIHYIEANYKEVETDMNTRNSISKRKLSLIVQDVNINYDNSANRNIDAICDRDCDDDSDDDCDKQSVSTNSSNARKKREELSILASSCIKKELVEVTVRFD